MVLINNNDLVFILNIRNDQRIFIINRDFKLPRLIADRAFVGAFIYDMYIFDSDGITPHLTGNDNPKFLTKTWYEEHK